MTRPNVWTITGVGGGRTRILVDGFNPQDGTPMGMGDEFSRSQVREIVEDLCRAAGLPKPWMRG